MTVLVLIASIFHIDAQLRILTSIEVDSESINRQIGLVVVTMWWTINRYLSYSERYAIMNRTFLGSTKVIASGLIGVMPLVIGFAYLGNVMTYMSFRFKSVQDSLFHMFGCI